jgi:hypothetical protein
MAVHPRKRQEKLAKRAAKRKAKHHQIVKRKSAGLAEQLTVAARFPVFESWASDSLWAQGLGGDMSESGAA